ncbi:hypothetical protein BN14_08335 [Rhizoctonia solani AG-1 IB]|uniref:Uncharacterized protein n=1 Tax=Thanatephorus cucumeris (strain AG1-IB / isolate 7/3/14) TaxID=1108050 RepID=M5C494_THACB|nr:hypothetical protein BN14_08335 [Rhizoctonia solani AG-1 IB]
MVNSTSSTAAPPAGSTAASHGSAKYSKDGTRVRITFRDGSQQTLPTIPKPQNIKKCKNIVDYLDFGEGKTFPRAMYLAIQQKMRLDMGTLLDNVAVSWSEVPYSVRQTVLTSSLATFPVLYRFPNNWVAEMLMVKVCRNRRDTVANKKEPTTRTSPTAEDQKTSVQARGVDKSKGKDEGSSEPQGDHDDEVADKTEGEEGLIDELIEDGEEQLDDAPTEDDPTSGDEFEDDEMEAAEQEVDEVDLDDLDAPEQQSQGDEHVTIDEASRSEAQVI